jgi:hypothetical protein
VRPFVLAAVLVAAAAAWWLTAGPPRPPATAGPPGTRRTERRPGPVPAAPAALPERNVFEYAGRPPAARAPITSAPPTAPPPAPEAVAPASPPPEPVRLVGLVQRGGRLRAVLSVQGEVAILGPGEQIQGYKVLAVDEERVRVQGPDGTERALARPEGY